MVYSTRKSSLALAAGAALMLFSAWGANSSRAGGTTFGYEALPPITHANLTIFPVVAAAGRSHDTRNFLTLDEGLRSGEVVVTEAGSIGPLMRRRRRVPLGERPIPPWGDGAQVNRLMLVNNSDRPLILLAGEIVTGGKQDRVVGKDRIVPPKSDPIDLSVFCVEPGRWVARSVERTGGGAPRGYPADSFSSFSAQMAQPSVRKEAMADKDQQKVWDEVHKSAAGMAAALPAPAKPALESTSSYAGVMENVEVQRNLNSVAAPIERSYESLIRELRAQNAVGVVVAVNGEIIWADVFASTALLEKYWPKLVRSYAAEAMTSRLSRYPDLKWRRADVKSAQAFLERFEGRRESVESEPGVYRHTEIYGDSFTAFELASLLPGTGFDVHLAKMTE